MGEPTPLYRHAGSGRFGGPLRFEPGPSEITALIHRAAQHPLGLEFLLTGELGSIAATFHAHAFTVLAARAQLGRSGH